MSASTYIDQLKAKYPLEYDCIITSFSALKDLDILLAIDKAYKAICKYCDWTVVPDDYVSATIQLATTYLNNSIKVNKSVTGEKSIQQLTQGSRSVSYTSSSIVSFASDGLTDDIKAMLPSQKLRCFD